MRSLKILILAESESADWRSTMHASARPMPIAWMQPGREPLFSLLRITIRLRLGPAAETKFDKARGFELVLEV